MRVLALGRRIAEHKTHLTPQLWVIRMVTMVARIARLFGQALPTDMSVGTKSRAAPAS
jgi:hypothetical protein